MPCDYCNQASEEYVVVTPRPSDPSEIVSVLAYCGSCATQDGREVEGDIVEVAASLSRGASVMTTYTILGVYMDSSMADHNGHGFLTI